MGMSVVYKGIPTASFGVQLLDAWTSQGISGVALALLLALLP